MEFLTEKGKGFQKNPHFKEASAKEQALAEDVEKKALKKMESSPNRRLPMEGIEKRLDVMVESPIWGTDSTRNASGATPAPFSVRPVTVSTSQMRPPEIRGNG